MEKFRKSLVMFVLSALSLSILTLSSCSDDEDPTYAEPTIAVEVMSSTPGAIQLLVAVTAPAGLKSVIVGDDEKTYDGETSDIYTYTYEGASSSLTFEVTDTQDRVAQEVVSIEPTEILTENITADATWTKDKKYLLKGNIFVTNNAKLTIQPGTVIYGDKESKGALVIERGSQILAGGTAAEPIVFTSSAPAGFRNYGDWGGVVLLGKATNNQNTNVSIEGITAGDLGKHGGSTDDDNSGTLTYVRIEFAGIALSNDNEINGLTFGSVGSGTTINHIQVSYSGDDAYEWFGGKVSATHLIAYRTWDDDFDTDYGFTGKVQFGAAFRDPNIADKSGSNLFESDNDGSGSANTPLTAPTFANISGFGPFVYATLSNPTTLSNSAVSANYQNGGHIRRNTALKLYNSMIVGAGTAANWAFRFTDSKGGANTAAEIKGNFIGRSSRTDNVATEPSTGTTDKGYSVADFKTDNDVSDPVNKVDLTAIFANMDAAEDINAPLTAVVQAATSPYLTGAMDLTDKGLTKTDYIGAVGTTADWLGESWVNFAPQTTEY